MWKRDLHDNIRVSPATNPGAITAGNATLTTATIDRQGWEAIEFVYNAGVITDGTFTITLYEGNASNMSDEAAVGAADLLIGTAVPLDRTQTNVVFVATTDNNAVKSLGYTGNKRYVRAKAVQSGAATGGYLDATVVQFAGRNTPPVVPKDSVGA